MFNRFKLFYICILLFLVGCGSTPQQNDYVKYINKIDNNYYLKNQLAIKLEAGSHVNLLGNYDTSDVADSSQILYVGDAGLAGLLVQIGTHASIIEAQRNEKLALAQLEANKLVQPTIDLAKTLPISNLVGDYYVTENPDELNPLHFKPLYFIDTNMKQLSIKVVAWVPLPKKKQSRKKKVKYQNIIQVFSHIYNEDESLKLQGNDNSFLQSQLSLLTQTALKIAKDELSGRLNKKNKVAKTYLIENGGVKKAIRGSEVSEHCGFKIIQDIRFWYYAFPSDNTSSLACAKKA